MNSPNKKIFYVGTSGWSYQDWKGKFYPENIKQTDWLDYYSQYFDTVELNASFYHQIRAETYANWREQVKSGDFHFSVKISKYLTHIKKLNNCEEIWNNFIKNVDHLQDKLGPVLVQIPGNLKANSEKLRSLLQVIPQKYKIAFEPRNETWLNEKIYKIMEEYNCGLVISDTPEWPTEERITADFVYLRLHGPEGLYDSKYNDKQLKEWADKLKDWGKKVKRIYVYFNNDSHGYAVDNALKLKEFLHYEKTF